MIFGTLNPRKIWDLVIFIVIFFTDLSTSPVRCIHFSLGNPKKSFSTVLFIHTSDYLRYLSRKQTIIHLPAKTENIDTLTCELQNFFYLTGGLLRPIKRWRLWRDPVGLSSVALKIKNQLWCVATGMSGKQCHSKCSEWPSSALLPASSLFRHWSVA